MAGDKPIRVSQHSGREGSARHNDRSFLEGRSVAEKKELAPHIQESREGEKLVMLHSWDGQQDFTASELAYYTQAYGAGQDACNARYVREGHPERCKTTGDLYQGKLTRPEEMILQIGDKNSRITGEAFTVCLEEYLDRLKMWSQEHDNCMRILTVAVHLDEASPHAHVRRVWEYTDRYGYRRLGQNKALEAAGLPLPNPEKPIGRYNNRKQSFDGWARGQWQEICKVHGFAIQTEPRIGIRHKNKADYISGQIQADIAAQEAQREAARAESERAICNAQKARMDVQKAEHDKNIAEQAKMALKGDIERLTRERDLLSEQLKNSESQSERYRQKLAHIKQRQKELMEKRTIRTGLLNTEVVTVVKDEEAVMAAVDGVVQAQEKAEVLTRRIQDLETTKHTLEEEIKDLRQEIDMYKRDMKEYRDEALVIRAARELSPAEYQRRMRYDFDIQIKEDGKIDLPPVPELTRASALLLQQKYYAAREEIRKAKVYDQIAQAARQDNSVRDAVRDFMPEVDRQLEHGRLNAQKQKTKIFARDLDLEL